MGIKERLVEIVGAGHVFDDEGVLRSYSEDYSLTPPGMPNYVVKPQNAKEIQAIIRLANEQKIPVIPSSSGVHFHGATIPSEGGIVVDLRRMNRILELDEPDDVGSLPARVEHLDQEPTILWSLARARLGVGPIAITPRVHRSTELAPATSLPDATHAAHEVTSAM